MGYLRGRVCLWLIVCPYLHPSIHPSIDMVVSLVWKSHILPARPVAVPFRPSGSGPGGGGWGLHMGANLPVSGPRLHMALAVLLLAVEGSWTLNRPRAVPELVNKRAGGEFRGGCGGAILSKVAKRERDEKGGREGIGHYAVRTEKVVREVRDSTVANLSRAALAHSPPSPGSIHPPYA